MDLRVCDVATSDPAALHRAAGGESPGTGERYERGAILVEYGMILVAILVVSFALIQFIGGRVLEMFQGILPAFG